VQSPLAPKARPPSRVHATRKVAPPLKRAPAKNATDSRDPKLIEFDNETFSRARLLARDRMMTIQELPDEAFRNLLQEAWETG
jgi:hypothetical protein